MATIKNGKGTKALVVTENDGDLVRGEFGRPAPGPNDVAIDIKFVGMCHSDISATSGYWGINKYPMAPGHEIAGVVTAVGADVADFKVGDRVGVGCMVESCQACDLCEEGLEQHCPAMVQTYSSDWPENKGHADCAGHHTNGGYSERITVHRRFVLPLPDSLEFEYAAPLLCAGITTYSPLARHVLGKPDRKVGIVGFGGLGHVAAKIALAMGAEVTIYSRSLAKQEQADKLGAKLVAHTDEEALKALSRTQHVILDTVSDEHEIMHIMANLKVGGTYVAIGGVTTPYAVGSFPLLMNRWSVEGSLIGGIPETADMLKFCAEHNIRPDIKIISADEAPAAYKVLKDGRAPALRNVIDISTL